MNTRSKPLISILIYNYNNKDLICKAIDSALSQSYEQLEVIVVDDCSSNKAFDFLKQKYGDFVEVVSTPHTLGISEALKYGYTFTKGQYIAFLRFYDYWTDTNKIAIQYVQMSKSSSYGLSFTNWVEKTYLRDHYHIVSLPKSRYRLKELFLKGGDLISLPTVLVSKLAWGTVVRLHGNKKPVSDILIHALLYKFYPLSIPILSTVVQSDYDASIANSPSNPRSLLRTLVARLQLVVKYFFYWPLFPRAFLYNLYKLSKNLLQYLKSFL